jgi:hypothetical protein
VGFHRAFASADEHDADIPTEEKSTGGPPLAPENLPSPDALPLLTVSVAEASPIKKSNTRNKSIVTGIMAANFLRKDEVTRESFHSRHNANLNVPALVPLKLMKDASSRASRLLNLPIYEDINIEAKVKILDLLPILASYDPKEKREIAKAMEQIEFVHGFEIVREGDEGEQFFIIVEGQVLVQKRDKQGTQYTYITNIILSSCLSAVTVLNCFHLSKFS